MKRYLLAAVAMAVAATASAERANALAITFSQDTVTVPGDFITAPTTHTGIFMLSTSGSGTFQSSPFPNQASPYSCLACGTPQTISTATYSVAPNATGFTIFWGSPDSYNYVDFYNGGTLVQEVGGSQLTAATPGAGHDLVNFSFNGNTVTSVVLMDGKAGVDPGTQAFEYSEVASTPLPAALPLFVGGLGMLGFLGRRRKRQTAAMAA